MQRKIVKACVRCGDKLFTGFDHGECFEEIERNDAENAEQGFIDNEGNFVDRKEAMIIAEKAGQLKYKLGKKTLISEDLHLNWLNKQADKIADLEAKLAESKRKYEDRKKFCIIETRSLTEIINNLLEENNQLKRQLVEKDKYTYTGKEVGDIERNYEQQLAEKEKELQKSRKEYWEIFDKLDEKSHLYEIELLQNVILEDKQNQTAIAELEKVRSKIARLDVSPDESNRLIPALDNYTNGFHKSRFKIVNILDQQIKSLKGEK